MKYFPLKYSDVGCYYFVVEGYYKMMVRYNYYKMVDSKDDISLKWEFSVSTENCYYYKMILEKKKNL